MSSLYLGHRAAVSRAMLPSNHPDSIDVTFTADQVAEEITELLTGPKAYGYVSPVMGDLAVEFIDALLTAEAGEQGAAIDDLRAELARLLAAKPGCHAYVDAEARLYDEWVRA